METKNWQIAWGVLQKARVPERVPAGSGCVVGIKKCLWLQRCCIFDAGSAAGSGGFRWAPAMQMCKWVKASCQKWRVPWPASGRPRKGFAGSRSGPVLDSDGVRAGSKFRRGFRWVLSWVPGMSAGFWPRSCENGPRLLVESDGPHGQLLEGPEGLQEPVASPCWISAVGHASFNLHRRLLLCRRPNAGGASRGLMLTFKHTGRRQACVSRCSYAGCRAPSYPKSGPWHV